MYWQERAQLIKKYNTDKAMVIEIKLVNAYEKAKMKAIKEFAKLIQPFLLDNGQYDIEAIKRAFRTDVKFQAQFSRLSSHIDQYNAELAELTQNKTTNLLEQVYEQTHHLVTGKEFDLVHKAAIEELVSQPWTADGINYSTRIWKNVDLVKKAMDQVMFNTVVLGQNPKKSAKLLEERFNVSKHQAQRLVRTETMACYSKSSIDSYREMGCTKYKVLGSSCDHCKGGQIYTLDQFEIGLTAPPFHPNCKCSIAPIY